jgi:hypothetical protein
MINRRYGRVLLCSSQGVFGSTGASHYSLNKAALIGFMRALSLEGAPHGINVNVLLPFAVTDMLAAAVKNGVTLVNNGEQLAHHLGPDKIWPVAGWLAHHECDVTGELLTAGGGHFSRVFMAQTRGHYDAQLSPEIVRDRWLQACSEDGYLVPRNVDASLGQVIEAMRQGGATSRPGNEGD